MWSRFKKAIHKQLIRVAIGGSIPVETYSQMGEDRILQALFAQKMNSGSPGYFVDIGAYHPIIYSNTWYFYKRGWCGLNVDARPGSKELFDRVRPGDTNVECAVSDREGAVEFLVLGQDSTINRLASNDDKKDDVRMSRHSVSVTARTLNSLLSQHVPPGGRIDFMSIDIEGEDGAAVLSTDWNRFRPTYLLVEQNYRTIDDMAKSETAKYLLQSGYHFFDLCRGYWPPAELMVRPHPTTLFFVAEEFLGESDRA